VADFGGDQAAFNAFQQQLNTAVQQLTEAQNAVGPAQTQQALARASLARAFVIFVLVSRDLQGGCVLQERKRARHHHKLCLIC
jgi:hypothetical protein